MQKMDFNASSDKTKNKKQNLESTSTVMKNKRYQMLMKILKKMKSNRTPKSIRSHSKRNEIGKIERYRYVTETGDIQWGYKTASGTFQVGISFSYF